MNKKGIYACLSIVLSTIIAILLHAVLPTEVNVAEFDGFLVLKIGFEVVATLYFLILFVHCAVVETIFGKKSIRSRREIGLRFGVAFGLIYLIGMQEIPTGAAVEWGLEFVRFEFFMGMGDMIPVIILCILISMIIKDKNSADYDSREMFAMSLTQMLGSVGTIAIAFFLERNICYKLGITSSAAELYYFPCYMWTLIFGIILGFSCMLIYPIFYNKANNRLPLELAVFTIGINWIWFNCFIGLIYKGAIIQALTRSVIDVIVLFVAVVMIDKYFKKTTSRLI